jgi:hypothetical protein
VFDHFTHDTSQGLGYASVDSYPVNDTTASNTTISTSNIPTFTSPTTGKFYDLRNCIDFRPIKTAATGLNPVDPETYQVPPGGLHTPKPSSAKDNLELTMEFPQQEVINYHLLLQNSQTHLNLLKL